MGLNVKVAMLISFGFIGSICWLVNEVAKPMIELPLPPTIAAEANVTPVPILVAGATAVEEVTTGFQVASAVQPPPVMRDEPDETELTQNDALAEAVSLPPRIGANEPSTTAVAMDAPSRRLPTLAATDPAGATSPLPDVADGASSAAPPQPQQAGAAGGSQVYEVKRGESLTKIARAAFNSSDYRFVLALIEANPAVKARKGMVLAGEQIVIPDLSAGATIGGSIRVTQATAPAAQAAKRKPDVSSAAPRFYIVRKGDSLTRIAEQQLKDRSRWREIARLNRLKDADRLLTGTRLKLPAADQDS